MSRDLEYRVRYRRLGTHEQVRIFQRRHYARRLANKVLQPQVDWSPIEYVVLEERPVGDWSVVQEVYR